MLDLVAADRPIARIAADPGISDQTIYDWRKQVLIDTGQLSGLNHAEQAEPSPVNKRIRELATEGGNWPTRSSTTWRSSTTANAVIPPSACALR